MASSSSTEDGPAGVPSEAADGAEPAGTLERHVPAVAKPIRVVSFWLAIFLPVLYVPLLFNGLTTVPETVWFLGMLGANVCCLYVGHSHRR